MQPNIESAAAQAGGKLNPFMLGYEAVSIAAYRDTLSKGLETAVNEANDANVFLLKAVQEGRGEGGAIDFDKITSLTGTADEKAEAIVLANSRLNGMEKAVAELRKAAGEKAEAEAIMEMNGFDASRLPAEYQHLAHQVLPYSAQYADDVKSAHGVELGSAEFRERVRTGGNMEFELAKNEIKPRGSLQDRSRNIMATLFQTTSWEPNKIYEPGWLPSRGGDHSPVQVVDLLHSGPMAGKTISYWVETTYDNNAAARNEGDQAAESAYGLDERTITPSSIAHFLPLTEEALEDRMELDDYIDYVMPLGVLQNIDKEIQVGNGTTPNIRGILSYMGQGGSGAYSDTLDIDRLKLPALSGESSASTVNWSKVSNPWDLFLDLRLKGMDHGYGILGMQRPNIAVAHVNLWGACLKSKPGLTGTASNGDSAGYYVGGPENGSLFNTPWGMQLRVSSNVSEAVSANNTAGGHEMSAFVFDNMPMFSKLYYRHGIRVRFGMVNDDFRRFKVSVRAEARIALAIKRPKAFIALVNTKADGAQPTG